MSCPSGDISSEDTRPILCPRCGHIVHVGDQHCVHCGRDLEDFDPVATAPVQNPALPLPSDHGIFPPNDNVILQFLPSGTCVLATLERTLTLGRQIGDTTENLLDLTHLRAKQHGVSREHCQLRRRDNHLIVIDLASTNGTYLNGKALLPYQEHIVAHGDELIIGTLHLLITFTSVNGPLASSENDVLEQAPSSSTPLM
ncbi:MAG: FHA domain-containing protein [Anaerolineae bacterium]|nr:FHA domain-containing protein [Anaerolineae bacterium]